MFGGVAHAATPVDWIEFHNTHTNENLRLTFRDAKGELIPAALEQFNRILGDHRSHEQHAMDPQLFVLLVDLAASADVEPHYDIISGIPVVRRPTRSCAPTAAVRRRTASTSRARPSTSA